MNLNLRQLKTDKRDLLRAIGDELRRMREDAGLSQAAVARAAGISPAWVSEIEAAIADPSIEVLLRLGAVLGADLSLRFYAQTGPLIRDRLQFPMSECLLSVLAPRWSATPEVAVYRPVRGVIDLVLTDSAGPDTVATELQSQLLRVEQQIRWSGEKAGALGALPGYERRRVGRLLVVRNTHAIREVMRAAEATMRAAYPARTQDAVAALTGTDPWPGAAIAWMNLDHGIANLLEGPPRGVNVGR